MKEGRNTFRHGFSACVRVYVSEGKVEGGRVAWGVIVACIAGVFALGGLVWAGGGGEGGRERGLFGGMLSFPTRRIVHLVSPSLSWSCLAPSIPLPLMTYSFSSSLFSLLLVLISRSAGYPAFVSCVNAISVCLLFVLFRSMALVGFFSGA